jgi:hypothetical protein
MDFHNRNQQLLAMAKSGVIENWHRAIGNARPSVLADVQTEQEFQALTKELEELFETSVELIVWPHGKGIPEPFVPFSWQTRFKN